MRATHQKYEKYEKKYIPDTMRCSGQQPFEYILTELRQHAEAIADRNTQIKLHFEENLPSGAKDYRLITNKHPNEHLFSYHTHDFIECNLVLAGSCLEYIDGRPFILGTGDILFLSADAPCHSCFAGADADVRNILIRPDLIAEFMTETIGVPDFFMREIEHAGNFIILRGTDEEESSRYLSQTFKVYDFAHVPTASDHKFAEYLLKQFAFSLQVGIERGSISVYHSTVQVIDRSIENILRYIRDNYATVSMPELSRVFGYSERHLRRFIYAHTGDNFKTIVLAERIFHAGTLLKSTVLPVANIAQTVGFESTSYFYRIFREQTGLTPLEFRRHKGVLPS